MAFFPLKITPIICCLNAQFVSCCVLVQSPGKHTAAVTCRKQEEEGLKSRISSLFTVLFFRPFRDVRWQTELSSQQQSSCSPEAERAAACWLWCLHAEAGTTSILRFALKYFQEYTQQLGASLTGKSGCLGWLITLKGRYIVMTLKVLLKWLFYLHSISVCPGVIQFTHRLVMTSPQSLILVTVSELLCRRMGLKHTGAP